TLRLPVLFSNAEIAAGNYQLIFGVEDEENYIETAPVPVTVLPPFNEGELLADAVLDNVPAGVEAVVDLQYYGYSPPQGYAWTLADAVTGASIDSGGAFFDDVYHEIEFFARTQLSVALAAD